MEALVQRRGAAAVAKQFTPEEWEQLLYRWEAWARGKQRPPAGDWQTWLLLAGRGFGKTRCGAEFVRGKVESGEWRRVALVGRTTSDVRDVLVEGPSGLQKIAPPWFRPDYEPSKRRLTWPNGAVATTYTAEKPDMLRGPEHDGAWCDELAAWQYLEDAWDNLQFGLRLGRHPQVVVTSTPRGLPFLRKLIAEPSTVTVKGSTYENRRNLPGSYINRIRKKYEDTRLGNQEIYAEILDDNPGALWKSKDIQDKRVTRAPELKRIGIGVDPAVTHQEGSNETGIIVGGVADCYCKGPRERHAFILEDLSGIYTPAGWAKAIIKAYDTHEADRIIPEVNNGGDLVEANLRAYGGQRLPIKPVRAAKGKDTRAEPVAALYEQGKVHHVGAFAKLEDQMTQWNPLVDRYSPDRIDALVHLLTDLMLRIRDDGGTVVEEGPILPRRI